MSEIFELERSWPGVAAQDGGAADPSNPNASPRLTGEQAVAKLPASIRVGPFDYAIEKMTANQSSSRARWGECSFQTATIAMAINFPTAVKAADTFVHEVNHAVWYAWGFEDGDKQERIVGQFATGWIQVYRDNPWLLGWLAECLR